MRIVQGQDNLKIEVELTGQVTENMMTDAMSKEIAYEYKSYDGSTMDSGSWEADGYFMEDDVPVIHYTFKGDDAIPGSARYLRGRAVITNSDGRIAKGKVFTIDIQPDELI